MHNPAEYIGGRSDVLVTDALRVCLKPHLDPLLVVLHVRNVLPQDGIEYLAGNKSDSRPQISHNGYKSQQAKTTKL